MLKSLVKAMQLLEHLGGSKSEYRVSDIAEALDLNKSNAHEILSTFEYLGYIKKNPENRLYSLDFKIMELSHKLSLQHPYQMVARQEVTYLSNKLGEHSHFGVPFGNEVMILEGGFPTDTCCATSLMGTTTPIHCTGLGKAILAHLPRIQIDHILSQDLRRYTDKTIRTRAGLLEELALIKERGYSVNNMEHQIGIKCVGVPVLDQNNEVKGGICLFGPASRFSEHRIEELAQMLKESALLIKASW